MNKEIILDEHQSIVSRTNEQGIIQYVNEYFIEISGYSQEELIGSNHNIIRHPDMPKAIFKFMWNRLLKDNKGLGAVVKNLTKDGDYYWVITQFTFSKIDETLSIKGKRTKANRRVIKEITPIYQKMLEIEKETNDIDKSLEYLIDVMKKAGYEEYDDFINYLARPTFLEKISPF